MSELIDIWRVIELLSDKRCDCNFFVDGQTAYEALSDMIKAVKELPRIDLVRCGECKHRPIKDDPDGADYGFNITEPTDGDDICPCLVEDGWYSWMPKDNFFCGRGERRTDEHNT